MRNAESRSDVGKGELVPDFHDEHLALFGRELIKREREHALRVVFGLEMRRNGMFRFRDHVCFAPGPAGVAAEEIEGNGTDGGEKKASVFDRVLLAPEAHESFLDDVFRVGDGPDELPGEKDQPGREFGEANFPIFMRSDIWHDLGGVFPIKTFPTAEFV